MPPVEEAPVRRRWERPAWAALLAFHFFLPLVLSHWHSDIPDESAYRSLAVNLATLGEYTLDFESFHEPAGAPNTYFAPGWPAVMAAGLLIVNQGETGFWVALGLAWCLAQVMTDRLGLAMGLGRRGRWLLMGWLTVNPIMLYYHAHLMTEPLTIALGLALLAIGARLVREPRWSLVLLLGVVSGLSHLTRTALLLPGLAVWLVAAATIGWRRLAPRAVVFTLVHLAVVAPWLIRMEHVGAGWRATEVKLGHNLYTYNHTDVANPYQLRPGESLDYPEGLRSMTPAGRDSRLLHLGLDQIRARPDRYLKNCLRRGYFLFSPLPNFHEVSAKKAFAVAATTVVFLYLPWALILAARIRGRRLDRGEWVLLTALLLWYTFHILLHASVRQRIPSDVWVAALALALWRPREGREVAGQPVTD